MSCSALLPDISADDEWTALRPVRSRTGCLILTTVRKPRLGWERSNEDGVIAVTDLRGARARPGFALGRTRCILNRPSGHSTTTDQRTQMGTAIASGCP